MPTRLVQPLLFLVAKSSHRLLARQLEYLKVENQILKAQSTKKRRLTKAEKRQLRKAGKPLGTALKSLMTIVTYTTWLRWGREEKNGKSEKPLGRPPIDEETRKLVIQIAEETGRGLGRIHGELKKLGIRISRSSIKRILEEHGLLPAPKGGGPGTWDDFVKRHAKTLWASDFVSKKVLTKIGLVDCFVLFVINVSSRRVHLLGVTTKPTANWMAQASRNLRMNFEEQEIKPTHFIHDRDKKFSEHFDNILSSAGVEVVQLPPRSPNMNAFAERWVKSFREECLNHFIVFGEAHMRHLAEEYVAHYNEERPHQSLGNRPLGVASDPPSIGKHGAMRCKERLGGLLRHYYWQAA